MLLDFHFALHSTLSDHRELSSYLIAYNLLYIHPISVFQAPGMLPIFTFSIWDLDVQKCYKIEDVLHQHKGFEKNSTSEKSVELVQPFQKQMAMGKAIYSLQ